MSQSNPSHNRRYILLIAVVVLVIQFPAQLRALDTTIAGVIKDYSGQSVAGAFVKIKSVSGSLTAMVISQMSGAYESPDIPPGKYIVQGIGGRDQSEPSAPVEVSKDKRQRMDITLTTPRKVYPPSKTFTNQELADLMPEGEAKQILLTHCVVCHTPLNFVGRRQTRQKWESSIDSMRIYLAGNPERVAAYNSRTGLKIGPLTNQERDVVLDYVSKNFGPDAPPILETPPDDSNRHLPRQLLHGAENKYIAMEFDLGNSAQAGHYVIDPEGIIWVCEKTTGILGRFDPRSRTYTRMVIPPGNSSKDIFGTVAIDPNGYVWFTSLDGPHSQWIKYDPKTNKVVDSFDVPIAPIPGGDIYYNTLRFAADGTVWATSTAKQRIVKLDPATRKVSAFPVRMGQHPFGMTTGPDGMVWFAGDEDNQIVRIDTATDKMTRFPLPTPNSRPRRLALDSDGNIWATTLSEGKLVKLDYRTGAMTEYAPPTKGAAQGIDIDKKRNVIWFTEFGDTMIGRFDMRTSAFVEFPLANTDEQPWVLQIDPTNPNRAWWNSRNGKLGYVQLSDKQD